MVVACIGETIKDHQGQENCAKYVRIIVNVNASPDIFKMVQNLPLHYVGFLGWCYQILNNKPSDNSLCLQVWLITLGAPSQLCTIVGRTGLLGHVTGSSVPRSKK